MTLIKSKNGAHLISGKAAKFHGCGAENSVSQSAKPDEKKAMSETDNSVDMPKCGNTSNRCKKGALRLFAVICLLAIIGVGAGYSQSTCVQEEIQTGQQTLDEASAVNAIMFDSSRQESLRRDPIRQDSIKFRKFSTPDLAFFELHGRVKSVHYDDANEDTFYDSPVRQVFEGTDFKFDKEGNLINKKKLFEPDGESEYSWVYNANGFPTKCIYPEGYIEQNRSYYNNGQLKKSDFFQGSSSGESIYTYNTDNMLTRIQNESHVYDSDSSYDATVRIVESDKWGNWTKRYIIENITEQQRVWDEGQMRKSGYKIIVDEYGDRYYIKNYTKKKTESRTITYYDE